MRSLKSTTGPRSRASSRASRAHSPCSPDEDGASRRSGRATATGVPAVLVRGGAEGGIEREYEQQAVDASEEGVRQTATHPLQLLPDSISAARSPVSMHGDVLSIEG